MTNATTDAELSLRAEEFVWRADGLTEAHSYILPDVLDRLAKSEAQTILDLGCGNGAFTSELSHRGYDVVGIDHSESGLAVARRSYPSVPFRSASVDAPLSRDLRQRFDVVIAIEVIEHLLLPRRLFERACEALRPGGTLIVTTPYHGYWKNLALALTGKFDQHWHPMRDFGHVKFFSIRTLSNVFQEQGFSVRHIGRVGRIGPLAKSMIIEGVRPA